MRKTCLPALFLAAAAASWAQEAAPASGGPSRSAKIAVIDLARVSAESLLGKGYAAQLETLKNEIDAEGTKKQNELQKLDADIKALQDELEKQGSVLSQEAADKKKQEIVRKTRDRQAFLEDGQAELNRMRERAQQQAQNLDNEFQLKIKPHIDAVVKDKGIDILLDSRVLQYASKDFDITREVIVKADDAERTAKAKAPAASAPAAKPAEKPADKPAEKPPATTP
jgi:Skp family chaperone for outer membrane proteins